MFRNYLTYHMAVSFHQSCMILEGLPAQLKNRLMRSSETMIHHFAKSVHTNDVKEEAKDLFVALVSLRDCKETLDDAIVENRELRLQFEVLHGRMEQICFKFADGEGGQLRMLG